VRREKGEECKNGDEKLEIGERRELEGEGEERRMEGGKERGR
jgi:hypothetical protein